MQKGHPLLTRASGVIGLLMTFLLASLLASTVSAAPGSWSSTGPSGVTRAKIAVDPSNPDIVYAAAPLSGLFKSTDAGLNWVKSDAGLAPGPEDVEVDPNNPARLFVIASKAVFRSTDGGQNWSLANAGITERVNDLAISTTLPTKLYAAGQTTVFASTTLGNHWTPQNSGLAASATRTFPIAVDPVDGDHVLVGQLDAGIETQLYETTTGGNSWSLVTDVSWSLGRGDAIRALAFGPGPTMYVASLDTLHSKLGAGAWTAGAELGRLAAIDPHPTDVGRVLGSVGFGGGVHETMDRGSSWVELGASITPNGFDRVLANDGVYRPDLPETLYVMFSGAGFQHSVDGGLTWTTRNNGLRANSIRAVAVHPTDPDYLYAGASNGEFPLGGIYRSTDNGLTWTQSNSGLDLLGVRDIAIDPNTVASTATTHLYAVGFGRRFPVENGPQEVGLFKSVDGGDSWFPRRNGIPDAFTLPISTPLRRLVMDPSSGNSGGAGPLQTLYVAGSGNPAQGTARIYKSTDAGANWAASEDGMPTPLATDRQIVIDLVIDPIDPENLYVGTLLTDLGAIPSMTPNGIFKSADGGASWSHSSIGLPLKDPSIPGSAQHDILALAIDPVTPTTLYAGVVDLDTSSGALLAKVYKSVDGAATWTLSSTGISPGADIRAIEVDANNPATVYAALVQTGGSPGGVYRSDDFGATWSSISIGLPASSATALAVDNSGSNSVIYAGTGSGVYELEQVPDLDRDGASSEEESAAPNSGDGNNDGTADADQTSVASIALPVAAASASTRSSRAITATMTKGDTSPYLTITIVGGSCASIVNAQVLSSAEYPQESAYALPLGMLSFELPDCESATVDLIFAGTDLSATDRIRSFGPTSPGDLSTLSSYDFSNAMRNANTWTLKLGDGQQGDVRPQDGAILFRGGPAAFINDLFADGFE